MSETYINSYGCLTPLGNASDTYNALLEGRSALRMYPVFGEEGGDLVPLALFSKMENGCPPDWLQHIQPIIRQLPDQPWGTARFPVILTGSNFGVGSLYSYRVTGDSGFLAYTQIQQNLDLLRDLAGWGPHCHVVSDACVSAHMGMDLADKLLQSSSIEQALIFSMDFISPFVAAGFYSLKILNGQHPMPFHAGDSGAIALGEGAAFAVFSREKASFCARTHALWNEMFHFTGNNPDGTGFSAMASVLSQELGGRRIWIKGHGTGTLETGKLEAEFLAAAFPEAPLVSWKGALGHTLGSCGLVELALACCSMEKGMAPGCVGSAKPFFTDNVAETSFSTESFDGVLCCANAFGGAHAGLLLSYE
ncbi:MAG: hypothetical protein JW739_07525 [Opitutales bacterium]|nr:hypothetical protein [Opitutales bacterium]